MGFKTIDRQGAVLQVSAGWILGSLTKEKRGTAIRWLEDGRAEDPERVCASVDAL